MFRSKTIWILALGLTTSSAMADSVPVSGSDIRFEDRIETNVGDRTVAMALTGTALREKYFFNVYAIASYVQTGKKVSNADELAKADVPKQLILVLERAVPAKDLAASVNESITANHDPSEFPEEFKAFTAFLKTTSVAKGDRVVITHEAGVGVTFDIVGKAAIKIENVDFSRAIWDIYFGKKNIGLSIKRGLVSRL